MSTQLLRGRVQNLRKTRCSQDFFFTRENSAKMGATAIAAGLLGLGGIATGLSATAIDTTEEADLLEFELDGKSVRAWVWLSVFDEGDEVEVVAEQWGDVWQGFGIRRVSDRIVALHPHCSRGRYAHYRASLLWWMKVTVPLLLIAYILLFFVGFLKSMSLQDWAKILPVASLGFLTGAALYGLIAYRIAGKFMGFVRLAEGIFLGFGWKNVEHIDLPALTKKAKRPSDPGALGVMYFRY